MRRNNRITSMLVRFGVSYGIFFLALHVGSTGRYVVGREGGKGEDWSLFGLYHT